MAEYKTYTCDICGEQEAIHFMFPSVDKTLDPVDVRTHSVPGYVDLCVKHSPRIVTEFVKQLSLSTADQRKVWKGLVK